MVAWVKELRSEELTEVAGVTSGKWKRYVSREEGGHGLIYGMGMLMPGEVLSHAHREEEIFYVLQGHGEAAWKIDDAAFSAELNPGFAFYKTANIFHTIRNTGAEPLVGIFCKV
jgi:mannose-6-phosphate isomerase-like protein (cupin superfamily)